MATSTSTVAIVTLRRILCVCASISLAMSQRRSVCGPGPHVLNQTGLDVYLLPRTYVTLQSVFCTNGRLKWRISGNKTNLYKLGTKDNRDNVKIGPMQHGMNTICVKYACQIANLTHLYVSNTAVLHLAESDVVIVAERGFTPGEVVHVTTGSAKRVFCYTLNSTNKDSGRLSIPMDYVLSKEEVVGEKTTFQPLPRDRYYDQVSCLWMNSLQQSDSGKYSLQIKTCVSSTDNLFVNFSISVNHPTAPSLSTLLSTQRTSLRAATTPFTSQSPQLTQSAIVAITSTSTYTRSVSMTSSTSTTLQLTLNNTGGYMKLGILIISVSVNTTLRVSYNLTGGSARPVTVHHDGEKLTRVIAIKRMTIILENVQKSDSGLYQVIATDDEENVTKTFRLVVQNETLVTSPYPTTLQTEAIGAAQADGPQGWVFGIIVLFVLLAIIIPTVYLSYRRRHFLRQFCFTRCHSFKQERQTTKPVYWNTTYDTAVKPTVSPNSERGEITTSTVLADDNTATNHPTTYSTVQGKATESTSNELPDIIAATSTQNNAATLTSIEESTDISKVGLGNATNEDHGTEPLPIYSTVHKEKKTAIKGSHTIKLKESKSPQTAATISKEVFGSAECMPLYATVSLINKTKNRHQFRDSPEIVNVQERTSTQRHTNDGRETPRRAAPYNSSSLICLSHTAGGSSTDAAGNNIADDNPHSIVYYSMLSTPTSNRECKSPDAFAANPPTQQHKIQYVELDIAALTKRK